MQLLEVSGAVRPLYGSLGVKGLDVFGVLALWACACQLCVFQNFNFLKMTLRAI